MFSPNHPKKGILYAAPTDNHSLLSMRFPQKLWKIVNECKTGAIRWGVSGKSIVLDYSKFQTEYLDNDLDIFKTSNITSFVRQLNLYGFRKVSHHTHHSLSSMHVQNPDIHEFRNEYFVQGRQDMLQKVSRKAGALKSRSIRAVQECPPTPVRVSRIARCQMAFQEALQRQRVIMENTEQQSRSKMPLNKIQWLDKRNTRSHEHQWQTTKETVSKSSLATNDVQEETTKNTENTECSSKNWTGRKRSLDVVLSQAAIIKPKVPTPVQSQETNCFLDPEISPKEFYQASESDMKLYLEDPFNLDTIFSRMDRNLSEKIYHILLADATSRENKDPSDTHFCISTPPKAEFTQKPLEIKSETASEAKMPPLACISHNVLYSTQDHSYPFQSTSSWDPTREYVLPDDGPFYNFGLYDLPSFQNYQ